jgi:hypothetical protein
MKGEIPVVLHGFLRHASASLLETILFVPLYQELLVVEGSTVPKIRKE